MVNWEVIREAFINRVPTPTLTELSREFGVSVSAVSRCASSEMWSEARLKRFEDKLKEAGASELILKAIQGEGSLVQACRETSAKAIRCADLIIERLEADTETKPSTQASTLNNVCFALSNLSNLIKSVGLVGMPGDIRNGRRNADGSTDPQTWEKGMLQQINVTVQNLQGQAKAAAKVEAAQPVVEVATEET